MRKTGTIHPEAGEPLLVDIRAVGAMLGRCERTIARDVAAGRVPAPCNINGAHRWSVPGLRKWVEDGCPACQAVNAGDTKPRSRNGDMRPQAATPTPGGHGGSAVHQAIQLPGCEQEAQVTTGQPSKTNASRLSPEASIGRGVDAVEQVEQSRAGEHSELPPLRGADFRKYITSGLSRVEWEAKRQPSA